MKLYKAAAVTNTRPIDAARLNLSPVTVARYIAGAVDKLSLTALALLIDRARGRRVGAAVPADIADPDQLYTVVYESFGPVRTVRGSELVEAADRVVRGLASDPSAGARMARVGLTLFGRGFLYTNPAARN
jgi:hypothetical protein